MGVCGACSERDAQHLSHEFTQQSNQRVINPHLVVLQLLPPRVVNLVEPRSGGGKTLSSSCRAIEARGYSHVKKVSLVRALVRATGKFLYSWTQCVLIREVSSIQGWIIYSGAPQCGHCWDQWRVS